MSCAAVAVMSALLLAKSFAVSRNLLAAPENDLHITAKVYGWPETKVEFWYRYEAAPGICTREAVIVPEEDSPALSVIVGAVPLFAQGETVSVRDHVSKFAGVCK